MSSDSGEASVIDVDERGMIVLGPGSDHPQVCVDSIAFRALSAHTPVEWAAHYKPGLVGTLLQQGYCATEGSPVVHAILSARTDLMGKDADVNARHWDGWTALHHACHLLSLEALESLVKFSQDQIAWSVRTPEGKTALQLAKDSPGWSQCSTSQKEKVSKILQGNMVEEKGEIKGEDGEDGEDGEESYCWMPGAWE